MPVFSQPFYRRRFEESVRFDRVDAGRLAASVVKPLSSEAEVLAVEDPAEFVREAYRFVLNRDPDVAGLSYFCEIARQQGRSVVILQLKQSDEGQQQARWATDKEVEPDQPVSTPAAATPIAPAPPPPMPELADLLAFPEGGAFVARAYLRILGRLPDPDGFASALRQFDEGGAAAVLYALSSSQEAASRGIRFKIHGQPLRPPSALDRLRARIKRRLRPRVEADGTRVSAGALGAVTAVAAPRAVVPIGQNVVATEIDGFIVGIPAEEWRLVAYHVFRGLLEPGVTRRFCETVRPGMVVIDVGANLGLYTLYAARHTGPSGRVHSFEPTPRMFSILRENIQINGLLETGLVQLHQAAASDRSGKARFAVYAGNNGHNTLFPDDRNGTFIEVDTIPLDDALAGEARIDVIKIDAEGAEPRIWAGMRSILERNPSLRVFMEFAPVLLRRAGHDPAQFLDEIDRAGFTIERMAEETGEQIPGSRESLLDVVSVNLLLTRGIS